MKTISKNLEKAGIHGILAYSYSVYFMAFIFGMLLHFLIPGDVIENPNSQFFGFWLLVIGTVLIVWAQSTSASTHKQRESNRDGNIVHHFKKGPYVFSRVPTHLGLLLALIGFALTVNSMFLIILSAIAFIITKNIILPKHEILLEQKYGSSYTEYRKSVKL